SASAALGKAGEMAGDGALTLKVKSALIADPDIKSLHVDVDTKDGAVTLNGSVPSAANSERAASLAKGVDGVKSVDNKLTVKAP
ncbi:MAG: BON domain-containing protein, partial [Caldimonas sp.]